MTSVLGDRQLDHQQLCYRLISAARSAASTQTSPAIGSQTSTATGDGIFFDTLTRSDCRVLDSLISHLQSDLTSKTLHPTPLCVVSILTSMVWIPAAAAVFDGPSCRRANCTVAAVTCATQIIRRLENALAHCLHIVLAMHGAIWSDELHASSTAAPREELIASSLFVIAQYRVTRLFPLRDVDIFKCIAEYLLDHNSDTSADASSREMAFRSLLNLVRRENLMMDNSWCWIFNDITALTLAELHRSVVSLTSGPSTGQLTTTVRAGELLDLLRGLVTKDDCWHLLPGVLTRCPAIMALVR